ncbi:hypothetical protein ACQPZ2_34115 [Nocardia pseudovaccinii]|uniref:hypothetical protein n=1 Tax=Nocardia pseudovaccinii TaxID=189540 RepID=UPI003D8DAE5E
MTDREPSRVDVPGDSQPGKPVDMPVTLSWPRNVAYVDSGVNMVVRAVGSDVGHALLIEVDFGEFPDLRDVSETQRAVRALLLALVDYEVSKLPERRPDPDSETAEKLMQIINEAAEDHTEVGDLVREILKTQDADVLATVVSGLAGRLPARIEASLSISSSVTVNPWQEVVQVTVPAVTTGGLMAAAARAGWVALRNVPAILDVIVRATTIKAERAARIAALEAEASIHQNEALLEIIRTSTEAAAARRSLDAILDVSPDIARRIHVQSISDEEANERRHRLLRAVLQDAEPSDSPS